MGLDQRSYSSLCPVSAWVGDHLWMGKPPRRRTRHSGRQPEPALCGLAGMSTRRKPESKQACRVIHQPVSVVLQCSLMLGCRVSLRISAATYGSGSKLEALHDDALYKYTFTLLYLVVPPKTSIETFVDWCSNIFTCQLTN